MVRDLEIRSRSGMFAWWRSSLWTANNSKCGTVFSFRKFSVSASPEAWHYLFKEADSRSNCIEKRFFSSYFFIHGRSGNISLMSAPLSHGGCGGCIFSGTTFYNFFYLRSRGIDQHNSRKKHKKKTD